MRGTDPGHPLDRTTERSGNKFLRWISTALFAIGFVLLAVYLAAYFHRITMVRSDMKSFENAKRQAASKAADPHMGESARTEAGGFSAEAPPGLASSGSPRKASSVPLAILRIPRIHLDVPVLGGTDSITLNRGVGRIAGTAAPGQRGNIGIAGHRDSFFQSLKEVNRGDEIELETTTKSEVYIVDRILVTGEDDLSVLQPRGLQSLTLVTCYPFHYVGPAPRRFVVQATIKGAAIPSSEDK